MALTKVSPRIGEIAYVEGKRWRCVGLARDTVRVKSEGHYFNTSVKTWLIAKKREDLDIPLRELGLVSIQRFVL